MAQAGVKGRQAGLGHRPTDDQGRRRRPIWCRDIARGRLSGSRRWYATIAAPNILENPDAAPVIERFAKKYAQQPENYSITAYDAALVILDAVKRVAASSKEVTRDAVRDAIQTAHVKTLQGEITFDENGDLRNREISVFRIVKDDKYPPDDVLHQYKYLGVAPQSS